MIFQLTQFFPRTLIPKIEAEPSNSLITEIKRRTSEYPNPEDNPSKNDGSAGFCKPKASVLPITMQFVMISPTYGPSCLDISGKNALSTMSTIITQKDMTRTSIIILTLEGIIFLIKESEKDERLTVKINPKHITKVFLTEFVTAKVEHMPRT